MALAEFNREPVDVGSVNKLRNTIEHFWPVLYADDTEAERLKFKIFFKNFQL